MLKRLFGFFALLFATASAAGAAPAPSPTPNDAALGIFKGIKHGPVYPLTCKIGAATPWSLNGNELTVTIAHAPAAATVSPVQDDQCAWEDRAMKLSEPTKICSLEKVDLRNLSGVGSQISVSNHAYKDANDAFLSTLLSGQSKVFTFQASVIMDCITVTKFSP